MTYYEEERFKNLTNSKLNKIKFAAKTKIGTTLRITKKTFNLKNCLIDYYS